METWENHFKVILNMRQSDAVFPPTMSETADLTFVPFSGEEVQDMTGKLKDKGQMVYITSTEKLLKHCYQPYGQNHSISVWN
jgi:hypothetical protein